MPGFHPRVQVTPGGALMARLRLLPPTGMSSTRSLRTGLPPEPLVPLLFEERIYDDFVVQMAWSAVSRRGFRCLLFGEREPHALIVRALVSHDLSPDDRARSLAIIRLGHLVLLGQAHDFSEPYLPRVAPPSPYVYLVTYSIERQEITACHSVQGERVTPHPVGILCPTPSDF